MSEIVERQDVPSLEADWDTFCAIEDEIGAAESTGIEARWRCGRMLLRYEKRQGSKHSPLVDVVRKLVAEFGLSETELYDRRQFAEDYPNFSDASEKFSSWRAVLEGGLGARGKRAAAERQPAPPIPAGRYGLIYADPPWQYDFAETDSRKVENQYPTLPVEDICALDVPAADNSVLYLWATAPKLREALDVLAAWGFQYVSNAVWVKDRIGMGYWFRGRHELLLVGKKGDVSPPVPELRPDSVIQAPRAAHSAKPTFVYQLLESLYPNVPRLELFAREARDGWEAWGNEEAVAA